MNEIVTLLNLTFIYNFYTWLTVMFYLFVNALYEWNTNSCIHLNVTLVSILVSNFQGSHLWQKCETSTCDASAFFCSSLVKTEPTWLHPRDLIFKAKSTSVVYILTEQPYEAGR